MIKLLLTIPLLALLSCSVDSKKSDNKDSDEAAMAAELAKTNKTQCIALDVKNSAEDLQAFDDLGCATAALSCTADSECVLGDGGHCHAPRSTAAQACARPT